MELQHILTRMARQAISKHLGRPDDRILADHPVLEQHRGVFVTLKLQGRLRGCIGSLQALESVRAAVRRHACNAAFHDHRFPPLSVDELPLVHISVSVLTLPEELPLQPPETLLTRLASSHEGLILRHPDGRSATFLPQVWQQLPRPKDFLAALARKAGLSGDGWSQPGIRFATYATEIYAEEGDANGASCC